MKLTRTAALLAAVAITFSGCSQSDDSAPDTVPAAADITTTSPTSTSSTETDSATTTTSETTTTTTATTTTTTTTSATTTTTTPATTTAKKTTTTKKTTTAKRPDIDISKLGVQAATGTWVDNLLYSGGQILVGDIDLGDRVRVLFPFYGSYPVGADFARMADEYQSKVGEGVRVYTMGIPLAAAFYMPANMQNVFTEEHGCILNIGSNLKSATNIDAYNALLPHAAEYLYSRTDHHWQPLGAYYAAQAFCEEAGVPFADLSTYKKCEEKNYVGSGYSYTGLQQLKTYPDTFTYYKPQNSYTVTDYNGNFGGAHASQLFYEGGMGYCTILGSDDKVTEIKTDVKNGRVLVLIKDSYGNALTPFFVGSFEKIYVIDRRYTNFKLGDFFKKVGATDVLFGMSLSGCYGQDSIRTMRGMF